MKKSKIYLLGILVFIFSTTEFLFAQTGSIHGTVKDTLTDVPLVSAIITLEGTALGAITDAEGKYDIVNVAPGTYTMHATFPGYIEGIVNVPVVSGLTTNQYIGLFPVTTFPVVNKNDSGPGTLRQAIIDANSQAGKDYIHFNIPGTGPHTIQPISSLPTISDPVVIDGYTQPGATPNTNPVELGSNAVLKIELDGINAVTNVSGLWIEAGNCVVRGLVINRFNDVGIHIQTNGGNSVEGNFIGTDISGTSDLGNADDGVRIFSSNNTIGGTTLGAGNVISGRGAQRHLG